MPYIEKSQYVFANEEKLPVILPCVLHKYALQ